MNYHVEITEPESTAACLCQSCHWTGSYAEVAEIGSCCLTPGDPSPAGRCPKCSALVYVMECSPAA